MKKYNLLLLVIGFIVLLVTQYKVVMPLVYQVIKSDLFLVDSKDKASQQPISTPLTGLAFMHCNHYIKSKLGPEKSIIFPDKPLNAWSLGNYQYVINAEIMISDEKANTLSKKYACRITYNNSDNEEGAGDFDNWTIDGVSGLEDI